MALSGADMSGARPPGAVEATRAVTPLGDIRQENIDRLVRLEVGKQFQAQILSRFNDGTFMVRIADTSARIALPGDGAVGDDLQLTLLATDPRPTFSLDSHSTAGAPAATGTPAARIAQALYLSNAGVQAAGAPLAESGAAPASLSSAGRLVANLLASARDSGASTALVGRIPLSNLPGAGATQLASALHDSLTFSGLFYESHVHQWANGERALTDLLREPQARGGAAGANAMPAAAAPATDVPAEVAEARRNLLEYFSTAPAGASGSSAALDAGAAQMINRQLHALEQQGVRWQGELYPGQPMEWEVRRRDEAAHSSGGEAAVQPPQQWQSVVRFSLPSLGVVSATINLAGEHVQIQVRTESEDAAAALRRHGPKLASALDVAGASLDALNIRRETGGDGDV